MNIVHSCVPERAPGASLWCRLVVTACLALLGSAHDAAFAQSAASIAPVANNQPSQSEDQREQREQREQDDQQGQTYEPYSSVSINDAGQSGQDGNRGDATRMLESKSLAMPAKPGEFERYVELALGRKIPRFGANLLTEAVRDFAVPAQATVPPDYPINVGDTIAVSLTGSIEGIANFVVDTDGRITIPKVGPVPIAGVRYRDVQGRIAQALGRQYRGYEVSVSIPKLRGLRVYVTGFANSPGAYSLNSLSTLVNAVLAAGGPNAGGSFRAAQLIRGGKVVAEFDLYELLRKGNRSRDPVLQNEDVIFIPPVGKQVGVIGSVNEEAIYELRPEESVADALRIAGGRNVLAEASRVILYRLSEKQTLGSREVPMAQTGAYPVEAGDIVQLLSEGSLVMPLERQQVIVRLEGEVNRPGNYYVAPGTPLSKVVEMAGGLTQRAYVYGTKLVRATVAAQQRTALKEAVDQFEFTLTTAPLTNPGSGIGENRGEQLAAGRQVLERLRKAEPDGRLVLPIPFDAVALPGDLPLENNDQLTIPPLVPTVGVYGSVYRPATFLIDERQATRVRDMIEKAGGVQRAGDRSEIFLVRASGEVLTRRRGAMQARLQPGDVIFVPVKVQSSSLLQKLTAISQVIFSLSLGAAAVAALR